MKHLAVTLLVLLWPVERWMDALRLHFTFIEEHFIWCVACCYRITRTNCHSTNEARTALYSAVSMPFHINCLSSAYCCLCFSFVVFGFRLSRLSSASLLFWCSLSLSLCVNIILLSYRHWIPDKCSLASSYFDTHTIHTTYTYRIFRCCCCSHLCFICCFSNSFG